MYIFVYHLSFGKWWDIVELRLKDVCLSHGLHFIKHICSLAVGKVVLAVSPAPWCEKYQTQRNEVSSRSGYSPVYVGAMFFTGLTYLLGMLRFLLVHSSSVSSFCLPFVQFLTGSDCFSWVQGPLFGTDLMFIGVLLVSLDLSFCLFKRTSAFTYFLLSGLCYSSKLSWEWIAVPLEPVMVSGDSGPATPEHRGCSQARGAQTPCRVSRSPPWVLVLVCGVSLGLLARHPPDPSACLFWHSAVRSGLTWLVILSAH